MQLTDKIFVAGHKGMAGSSIIRRLAKEGFENIVTADSSQLDLRNQNAVNEFFRAARPTYVFLAAAKVGGIVANNTYRADFIYDNLMIQSNVIKAAAVNQVEKLLFLGSSCIYPKMAPQPIVESYFLTGELEPTNQPYAIAKIAGIEMCRAFRQQYGCNFISCMPTNLYGPNDNYDLNNSHVLPALFRKFLEAKKTGNNEVVIWGTGAPLREFMHVDDLADACVFLMRNYDREQFLNVGTGEEISIADLAGKIASVVGFGGNIRFDSSKPDGTPRKLMDSSLLRSLGWAPKISLNEGLNSVYNQIKNSF